MPGNTRSRNSERKPCQLSHGRLVVFNRKGLILTTDVQNATARRVIESALSYERMVHLRGQEARMAGSNVVMEEVACYDYVRDSNGILPEMLITTAGWIGKLRQRLKRAGFEVKVINRTPHPKPEIFVPQWDRLRNIELRWKQDQVINTVLKYDYARVDCPTGYGKSWMIAAICQLLPKARFHITTHSKDVIEQLYFDLATKLPSVGICTGAKKKRLDSRVMLFSGKSLHRGGGDTDILIVDEVHEFGTVDYMQRVQKYRQARIYGFSASHNARNDKADFELEGLFGQIRAKVSYQEGVEFNCVVPIKVFWHDVVMDINPCAGVENSVARNRWGIWRNDVRNRKIADAAKQFDDDTQVLIVVDTVDHAVHLKKLLPEFELCYSEAGMDGDSRRKYVNWGLIDEYEPIMTDERRHRLKTRFSKGSLKKVIATGVWNRGVDFRNLQVVIRADAKASKIADTQIPGRVARLGDGKDKPHGIVVDFRDQFDDGLRDRANKRRRNYVEMGWEQVMPLRRGNRKTALGGDDPNQGRLF